MPEIRAGEHIVALFSRPVERDAVLYPYVRDGLACDDSCTTCLSNSPSQTVLDRLSRDVDLDANRASGRLAVCRATDWPRTHDRSGSRAASTLWDRAITRRSGSGVRCARFPVEARAWLPELGEPCELLRFESRLTSMAVGRPITFMFMYDVSDLDGGLVIELARAHPVVWMSGVAVANPYFNAS